MDRKEKIGQALVSLLKAAAFFAVYFLASLAVTLFFSIIFSIGASSIEDATQRILDASLEITLISNVVAILGCIVLIALFRQRPSDALRANVNFSHKGTVIGLCAALGVFGQFAIGLILALIPFPESWMALAEENSSAITSSSMAMQIISVVIAAPLAEEIIFRGCIQRTLSEGMPKYVAIGITAVVFGLMHGHPIGFVYATALGVLMGWLFAAFDSIVPSLVFHALFNLMSVLLPESAPLIFFIVSVPIFGFCIGYLIYLRAKKVTFEENNEGDNDDEAL